MHTHMHAHKYNFLTMMYVYRIALIQFTNFFERWNLWRSTTTNLVKEKQSQQIRNISAVRDFSGVCVGMFVASLSATFCLLFLSSSFSFKPGSESFYRYGNHPWESSNTWPHQNSNHIREAGRGGAVEREGEAGREVGGDREGRGGRERRGEWPTDNHIKPHTPYQKDGWGRRQTAIHPLQRSKFLFLSCISFCVPFIHFGSQILFFSSLTVFPAPSVSPPALRFPLFFILFLSAFLPHFRFQFTPLISLFAPSTFLTTMLIYNQCIPLSNGEKSTYQGIFFAFQSFLILYCPLSHARIIATIIWVIPSLKFFCLFLPSPLPLSFPFSHPPSLIITIQSHQITNHVFYVKP